MLRPKIAVLDEIDSGLDIDALRAVARRVEAATKEIDLGVLAITHYRRLLAELKPDVVHVLRGGRIVATGGPELADELEHTGYEGYEDDTVTAEPARQDGATTRSATRWSSSARRRRRGGRSAAVVVGGGGGRRRRRRGRRWRWRRRSAAPAR